MKTLGNNTPVVKKIYTVVNVVDDAVYEINEALVMTYEKDKSLKKAHKLLIKAINKIEALLPEVKALYDKNGKLVNYKEPI